MRTLSHSYNFIFRWKISLSSATTSSRPQIAVTNASNVQSLMLCRMSNGFLSTICLRSLTKYLDRRSNTVTYDKTDFSLNEGLTNRLCLLDFSAGWMGNSNSINFEIKVYRSYFQMWTFHRRLWYPLCIDTFRLEHNSDWSVAFPHLSHYRHKWQISFRPTDRLALQHC